MSNEYILAKQSSPLHGEVSVNGAKNSVLAILASLILTEGTSVLTNIPCSTDVLAMIHLLNSLGAKTVLNSSDHSLTIDTRFMKRFQVEPEMMKKMRASILVMGPLLARFGMADVAAPGGCVLGARPIDFHLKWLRRFGVTISEGEGTLHARVMKPCLAENQRIVLDYPSVGATENIMMFAAVQKGETTIINAAFEPEVFDLIAVLKKMGCRIVCEPGMIIHLTGTDCLQPITHEIMPDRLEAGALLIASAMIGGEIVIRNAPAYCLDIVLEKLRLMGHRCDVDDSLFGIRFIATPSPQAVNFKTGPYPSFPTDLQAPMMAAQCLARGKSIIEETVFENRLGHIDALRSMGAAISVDGGRAFVEHVSHLQGCGVVASDIRASCALVLAGLVARGETKIRGIHHWRRGYEKLEAKLALLGANIKVEEKNPHQYEHSEVDDQSSVNV